MSSYNSPSQPQMEWIPATPREAPALADRCVVAGYEGHDESPLWVIRARYQGDLIPGKLAVKRQAAYVPWMGLESDVTNIEVLCARPETIHWVDGKMKDEIPVKAIPGGQTWQGETLYIGRAKVKDCSCFKASNEDLRRTKEQDSFIPGKISSDDKLMYTMYMPFAGGEHLYATYQILCTV